MLHGPGSLPTWLDSWDVATANYFGVRRNDTATSVAIVLTALGDGKFLTPLVLLAAGILAWRKRQRAAILLLLSGATASAVGPMLKFLFARARPDESSRLVFVDTFSFPSNHALSATTVYLALAQLLRAQRSNLRTSAAPLVAAMLLILAIDTTRIYLGVHYLSDVIAGTCVGIAIAAFFALFNHPK